MLEIIAWEKSSRSGAICGKGKPGRNTNSDHVDTQTLLNAQNNPDIAKELGG